MGYLEPENKPHISIHIHIYIYTYIYIYISHAIKIPIHGIMIIPLVHVGFLRNVMAIGTWKILGNGLISGNNNRLETMRLPTKKCLFFSVSMKPRKTRTSGQWEFQDPKMEVLYHIRPYFLGIFPYIRLIYGRYLQ